MKRLTEAYDLGYQAGINNHSQLTNPYKNADMDDGEYLAWIRGWNVAKMEGNAVQPDGGYTQEEIQTQWRKHVYQLGYRAYQFGFEKSLHGFVGEHAKENVRLWQQGWTDAQQQAVEHKQVESGFILSSN